MSERLLYTNNNKKTCLFQLSFTGLTPLVSAVTDSNRSTFVFTFKLFENIFQFFNWSLLCILLISFK